MRAAVLWVPVHQYRLCLKVDPAKQSNSARLEFPQDKEHQRITIWNTACPPDPRQIGIFPDRQGWPKELAALKVARVGSFNGITFFMSGYSLDAIHLHTASEPCAQDTVDRLASRHYARKSAWAYIPLPATDHISEFGLRVLRKGGDNSHNDKHLDISCLCLLVSRLGLVQDYSHVLTGLGLSFECPKPGTSSWAPLIDLDPRGTYG